jgi:hypothetical protein
LIFFFFFFLHFFFPFQKAEARKEGVYYHEGVETGHCHRLRQCTEYNCSQTIHHRDFSSAGFICVILFLRMYGGHKDLRQLVDHLVDGSSATPEFLQRGKPRTPQSEMVHLKLEPKPKSWLQTMAGFTGLL